MTNRLRPFLSTTGKILVSSVITALFIVGLLLVLRIAGLAFVSPTSAVAPPVVQPPAITVPITSSLSYSDALGTYEKVASSAIKASERALDLMKLLVGAIVTLSATATVAAAYLYKTTREAGEKAQRAESEAKDAKVAAAAAAQHLDTITQRYTRLADRYFEISHQYLDFRSKNTSLDSALHAFDRGEITGEQARETQQLYSWLKWKQQRDRTGWLELYEEARYGEGLTKPVRAALEMELDRLQQRSSEAIELSQDEQERRKRLNDLLNPPDQ